MLRTSRIITKILCCINIGLIIVFVWNSLGRVDNFNKTTLPYSKPIPCRWPPVVLDDIRTNTSTYNFTICLQLKANTSRNDPLITYPIESLFRNTGTGKMVSFREISDYSRLIWRLAIYPNVWRTYPQDVPIRDIIKAVKSGSPVSAMPEYNFPINVLNTSRSVCAGRIKHDLVIIVKSGILGWEKRDLFRAFIEGQRDLNPNIKIGVVFSIGLPRQHGGRLFNRNGYTTILRGPVGDMMDAYAGRGNEVMQKIAEEIRKYDDIILADYEDTYYNLTWKTVTNLRWLSAFCDKLQNDMFMIIDDDHRVNVSMLMRFLATVPRHVKRTSLLGRIARNDGAFRSPLNKLYLAFQEIPWNIMCPYPRGFCQLIGADIVDDMAIGSAYTRYNYIHEDVYLGLLAFKLGIPLYNVYTMFDHREYERRWPPNASFMVVESRYWDTR